MLQRVSSYLVPLFRVESILDNVKSLNAIILNIHRFWISPGKELANKNLINLTETIPFGKLSRI